MQRRDLFPLLALAPALLRGAPATLRGHLATTPDGKPALKSADGKLTALTGDDDTVGVLKDKRLAGAEFELIGEQVGDQFKVGPIHTRAMFVHKGGKRLAVTYWCDVCAIRTYTPGICWCCREETELDLRDPDTLR